MGNTFMVSAGDVKTDDVKVLFADGEHVLEAWMVAHLGGTAKVDNPVFRQQAAEVTHKEFVQAFFAEASEQRLREIGKAVINQHLAGLRKY